MLVSPLSIEKMLSPSPGKWRRRWPMSQGTWPHINPAHGLQSIKLPFLQHLCKSSQARTVIGWLMYSTPAPLCLWQPFCPIRMRRCNYHFGCHTHTNGQETGIFDFQLIRTSWVGWGIVRCCLLGYTWNERQAKEQTHSNQLGHTPSSFWVGYLFTLCPS
jgi:hypothetical protein